jgi:K+-transporting ATPase KdpF subunit
LDWFYSPRWRLSQSHATQYEETIMLYLSAILLVLCMAYLVYAIIDPERF